MDSSSTSMASSASISHLVDPTSKHFLGMTLQKCHTTRISTYTRLFNISVFLLFVAFIGGTLYYLYKRKPTEYDRRRKMIEEQQYIMSKIRFYQGENLHTKASSITQLPMPEEDYYARRLASPSDQNL